MMQINTITRFLSFSAYRNVFMKFIRISFIFILFFGTAFQLKSQESLLYNKLNPELIKYRSEHKYSTKSTTVDTLEIPFRDDFSSTTLIPDSRYWEDQYVYINSNMADSLKSIGIATFDIIDENGKAYTPASESSFPCDYLTSKPLNLKYTAADSVVLSFYFLPGGKGGYPSSNDSLILEFYNNDSAKWSRKWFALGSDNSTPITKFRFSSYKFSEADSQYLVKGFQFRFRNTASVPDYNDENAGKISQIDMWHLDYVYLDTGRTQTDSLVNDIAFHKPLTSIFNSYTTIPFSHLSVANYNELRSEYSFSILNNFQVPQSPLKYFSITDSYSGKTTKVKLNGDQVDANSYYTVPFILKQDYFETSAVDQVTFTIKLFTQSLDKWPYNDTAKYSEKLAYSYAYDDGTSEMGYSLNGDGANGGLLAYAYNTLVTDTLTGIQIYFNPVLNDVTAEYSFALTVWDDKSDKPNSLVYLSSNTYSPSTPDRNKFVTYALDSGIVVSERFYIGIEQLTDNFLNIGYDLDNDNRSNLFYNTTGTWYKSGSMNSEILAGSLMMRPVFGVNGTVGVHDIKTGSSISIFPNPADGYFKISGISETDPMKQIIVYNTLGKQVLNIDSPSSDNVNISELSSGMYIVKIISKSSAVTTVKLLKK
jgi:hypothetical protein